MSDLRSELQLNLRGRIAWLGLGNRDYGDDGFGLHLADALVTAGLEDVQVVGTQPERWLAGLGNQQFDQIVFLDAVEIGAEPGSVVLLDSQRLTSRFPQVSTHKISLGTLAWLVESESTRSAWLLGAQPASLKQGSSLSPQLQQTAQLLATLLREFASSPPPSTRVAETLTLSEA